VRENVVSLKEEQILVTMTNDNVTIDIIQSEPIVRQEPLRNNIVIKPHVRLMLLNEIYQIEHEALDVDPFTCLRGPCRQGC